MSLEQIGEQVMVAEPPGLVVQWENEDVRPLQRHKQGLPILASGKSLAQSRVQALQDGSLQQECPHILRLLCKNFLEQVFRHIDVAAGKSLDEPGNVTAPLH